MACVGGGSSKQEGHINRLSYGDNQVGEGEELPWKLVTRKKQSKSRSSQKVHKSRFPKYEPSFSTSKSKDITSVINSGERDIENKIDMSEFPPLLHVVRTTSRGGDGVTSKFEECDVGADVSSAVNCGEYYIEKKIKLPGDTDVESYDGEDDDDGFEDQNDDARLCDPGTWWDTLKDANREIKQKEAEMGVEETDGRIIYHVYVDAYFKRNKNPRFGIVLKDPSKTVVLGFVEKSKSRGVPQLHTHLEGFLKAAELAKDYVDKEAADQGKEVVIYIYSNFSFAVNVVEVGWIPVKEQITEGVRRIMKQLLVFIVPNNISLCDVTNFENRAADYLARSPTLKVGQRILEKDFDDNMKTFIEQDKILEDMKSGHSTPETRAIILDAHRAVNRMAEQRAANRMAAHRTVLG